MGPLRYKIETVREKQRVGIADESASPMDAASRTVSVFNRVSMAHLYERLRRMLLQLPVYESLSTHMSVCRSKRCSSLTSWCAHIKTSSLVSSVRVHRRVYRHACGHARLLCLEIRSTGIGWHRTRACLHAHPHACMDERTDARTHGRTHACTPACTHARTHGRTDARMHVCMHERMLLCVHALTYVRHYRRACKGQRNV